MVIPISRYLINDAACITALGGLFILGANKRGDRRHDCQRDRRRYRWLVVYTRGDRRDRPVYALCNRATNDRRGDDRSDRFRRRLPRVYALLRLVVVLIA